MSKFPDLTVYGAHEGCRGLRRSVPQKCCTSWRIARFHMTMSILVSGNMDNTLAICRSLVPKLPFECRVRSIDDLPRNARSEIAAIVDSNDGFYNEGIVDWLVNENLEQCTYYAGMHIDLVFRQSGLWDELLAKMITIGADVAGIFAPGELLPREGNHVSDSA